MAYFPPLRNTPISSLARIQGAAPTPKDRRERRAVAESHQTANDIAAFLSGFRPAQVLGADGKVYTVEAKQGSGSVSNRVPWSVAFSGSDINIAIPLCIFVVTSGASPDITVNGTAADYVDPTKNVLALPSGLSHLFLELTVDDTAPNELHTQSVRLKALSDSQDAVNTLTRRYIPVTSVNTSTQEIGPRSLTAGIQTFRRGDREEISNMVVVPF